MQIVKEKKGGPYTKAQQQKRLDEVIKHLGTQVGENVGYFLDEETGRIYLMTQLKE